MGDVIKGKIFFRTRTAIRGREETLAEMDSSLIGGGPALIPLVSPLSVSPIHFPLLYPHLDQSALYIHFQRMGHEWQREITV